MGYDVDEGEVGDGEDDRTQEFLKILAASDMVNRRLRASDECRLEGCGTRVNDSRLGLCHRIIRIAREGFALL